MRAEHNARGPVNPRARPRLAITSALALVLGICLGTLSSTLARDTGLPAGSSQGRQKRRTLDEQVQALSDKLTLSPEQRAKLKRIFEHRQMLLERIRQNTSLSAVDRFHSMQAVSDESTIEIRNILDGEQAKKFDQLMHKPPADTSTREEKSDTH